MFSSDDAVFIGFGVLIHCHTLGDKIVIDKYDQLLVILMKHMERQYHLTKHCI